MTELEIEKLADALARRMQYALTEQLHYEIKEMIEAILADVIKRLINQHVDVLASIAREL